MLHRCSPPTLHAPHCSSVCDTSYKRSIMPSRSHFTPKRPKKKRGTKLLSKLSPGERREKAGLSVTLSGFQLSFYLHCVASARSWFFSSFLSVILWLPIGLHSSCSISPMASGTCQKWLTKYHDWVNDAQCSLSMRYPSPFIRYALNFGKRREDRQVEEE